jgi:hypothetical protein
MPVAREILTWSLLEFCPKSIERLVIGETLPVELAADAATSGTWHRPCGLELEGADQ